MEVVGESHYQPALRAAARGRAADGWDEGILVEAAVIPDPSNPYDRNAVRIEVDGQLVGHLPRHAAAPYQRELLGAADGGAWGTCTARILGGGHRSYGIWLQLAPADLAVPANEVGAMAIVEGGRRITVTGEEAHQEELLAATSGRLPRSLWATLVAGSVRKGKYAGEACIDVHVDGSRVGCLTRTMSDRYAHLLPEGPVACAAVVERDARGMQVEILLP